MKSSAPFILALLITPTLAPLHAAPPSTSGKPYGLEAARESIKEMKTADGLAANLFAAEPMIQNPTNIDIDHRGRVWAVEAVNYRSSMRPWGVLRPEGDRVVILGDTDNDGAADKETTFWQTPELKAPLGICVLPQAKGTKVIVSAAPNVWLVTDEDGDDKADKQERLFQVKGNWDHDHQIHAFVFGPDGKFYFNMGNESKDLLDADGKFFTDLAGRRTAADGKPYRQGLVVRCDIDLATAKVSNVEVLGHNFRNNYEVCIDSFGTLWQSDNDDDGNKAVRINYVMEFGNYGYGDELTGAAWQAPRTNIEAQIPLRHWHQNDPGTVPNLLQTGGGSPTGILINEGTGLGPNFANQLIHCDAGPNTTRAYPVENDGAGYKATMVDVLTSRDKWYRPADVAIAPDGALFVADWFDPGVGGHNMGDHDKGSVRGRIYRVSQGAKGALPKADLATASGASAALESPNRAAQYAAWRALHAMGAGAEAELLGLWKNQNPRVRARALGLLAQIKGSETKHLAAGLNDADANIRIAAIRLCRTLEKTNQIDTTPLDEDRALVAKLVRDPSPQVRRQIAISLHGAKEIAPLWAALALQHDGKDRWYLEALGIGAAGNEDACFDAWLASAGDKWNTPAGRDIIWRMRASKTAGYLAKIIGDKALPTDDRPRFLRSFDFLPESPDKTKALVQLAGLGESMNAVAAEALARLKNVDMSANPEVKAALDKQLASSKATPRFIELVRDFRLKGQGAALLEAALKYPKDPLAGDALKLVLAEPDAMQIVTGALAGPQAEGVIALLGTSSNPRTVGALTHVATTASLPVAMRASAIQALARSQTGAQAIVQLAKNNELPPDLKSTATTALNLVQFPKLKADIAALFPAAGALGGKPLPPVAELVKLRGDVAHGKAVFERAESSCVACHRINDKGMDFGPALGEIGSKLPKEVLYEAIIEPNRGLSMGFETTQLETKDGTVALGIVRSETAEEVVLALPGGVTNKFAKNQISKREKLPTSMMPSGLNQALSQQDLVDLVEYLVSLKAAK